MAETIYLLCSLTALLCAVLLLRAYRRTRQRLLLWSSLCFAFLLANNGLLFTDLVLLGKGTDLAVWRTGAALLALAVLLYGLIWDAR